MQEESIRMDRRYSSSSSSTATETAKKAAIGNALNSSIRFRNANSNGLSSSSSDSTVSPSHRKSFPSTSDVGSSFNSTNQVITLNSTSHFHFHFSLSTFRQRARTFFFASISGSRSITSRFVFTFIVLSNQNSTRLMSRWASAGNTISMFNNNFIARIEQKISTRRPHGDTSEMNFCFHVVRDRFLAFFPFPTSTTLLES